MSTHARRIDKLTTIYRAFGCPTCRAWGVTAVQVGRADELPAILPRPDRCPHCRRRAPRITPVVQIVMPTDDDDAGVAS